MIRTQARYSSLQKSEPWSELTAENLATATSLLQSVQCLQKKHPLLFSCVTHIIVSYRDRRLKIFLISDA